jgi:hypothetical protein
MLSKYGAIKYHPGVGRRRSGFAFQYHPAPQAWLRILLGGEWRQDDRVRWSFCRT